MYHCPDPRLENHNLLVLCMVELNYLDTAVFAAEDVLTTVTTNRPGPALTTFTPALSHTLATDMSNSTQQDGIDIPALQAGQLASYMVTSETALYCFDWLVTLDQEAKYIWAKRWTLSTWVFAINRYASLLYAILSVVTPPTLNRLVIPFMARRTVSDILKLSISAASDADIVSAPVCRIGAVFRVTGLCTVQPQYLALSGGIFLEYGFLCREYELSAIVSFSTRGCVILADVIVLVVTWIKAIGVVRAASRLDLKVPLSEILIRDGTIFFIALLGINIYVLLANGLPTTSTDISIFGSALLEPFVPSLICGLMRSASHTSEDQEGTAAHSSTIRFNSNVLIGNMGESLRIGTGIEE
ncbi:hypothetical protein BC835DRAFT_1419660 [Cytidiella melzeri]|nr:hypothetical protein BC835DRAFT_1419660 [Cytidiella melzeri]